MKKRKLVGKATDKKTTAGRTIYETDDGKFVSEISKTIPIGNNWYNVPSIYAGKKYTEDELKNAIKNNRIIPTSVHSSYEEAIKVAKKRSDRLNKNESLKMGKVEKSIRPKLREFEESYTRNFEPVKLLERNKEVYSLSIKGEDSLDSKDLPKIIKQLKEGLTFGKDDNVTITPKKNGFTVKVKFAKGGEVMEKPTEEQQMEMMLEGGGLKDEGGTTDPVSGNEVPDGATQKGVRDDVPAMLSEGEYVMNEASTRYHGVDKFNQMQEEAKQGYKQMERDGLLGEPVDDTEEALPFGIADLNVSDEEGRELMMAEGGDVSTQRKLLQDDIDSDVFNVRRREQPTFGESMGGSGLQFKQYKNADGMNVMIPFINGVPMFSNWGPWTPPVTADIFFHVKRPRGEWGGF